MKNKKIIGIILPIFILIGSFIYYGFSQNTCPFEGCKLAENLLKFPEIYLEIAGFIYFITLLVLNLLKKKYLYKLLLVTGIIFEATIYSYEIVQGVFCPLCTTIILSLIYLGILEFKTYILSLLVIPIALFILTPIQKNNIKFNQHYNLIYSLTCPHCKKVEKYLDKTGIKYSKFTIKNNKNLIAFLHYFNINEVPVLIVKNKNITLIKGDKNILNYFKQQKENPVPSILNLNNKNSDILNNLIPQKEKFEGCSIINPKSCKN